MKPQYNKDTRCYEFDDVLYFNKSTGILGSEAYISEQGMEDEEDEVASVKFQVKISVPAKVFQPYVLHVDIPPEFIADDVTKSAIESIEIPIELEGNVKGEVTVTEKVKGNRVAKILSLVKEALVDDLNKH